MRDFLLNDALQRLATEAATRFATLVAAGEEIPFDVAADAGEDSPFFSYVPLTGRYVRDHAEELAALPSFAAAREAAVEAGVAAPYLEARGEAVPADPGARAALMLSVFFASLWEGASSFALDRARLEEAIATLDAEAADADEAEVVIAPIVGLRMSTPRLTLPHGVCIVRADSIEAPVEAMRSEGMGRAAWEPQFLAVAEQDPDHGADGAVQQLRELISVMRLFKAGGIGLGPYAFAPTGAETWRRIPTGAAATRPGGYRLSESEAGALAEFATTLESRPDPDGALTWAVGRFEMGCERESPLQGLSDHLLALRAVLEGHGPVGASLPMRAAALIASDGEMDRIEAREQVEETLELERAAMNGRYVEGAAELALWAEEKARTLLRAAALGELGNDLIGTADETLIATGLAEGDAEITVSVVASPADDFPLPEPPLEDGLDAELEPQLELEAALPEPTAAELPIFDHEEESEMQETRIMEPIPAEDEIKITATPWLDEIADARPGDSLEWPAPPSDRDIQHRERIDTPRVRHLFPVPDSDWEVSHLEFEYERPGHRRPDEALAGASRRPRSSRAEHAPRCVLELLGQEPSGPAGRGQGLPQVGSYCGRALVQLGAGAAADRGAGPAELELRRWSPLAVGA
ncbi:MAG: hypothetical protein U0R71_06245 [Solirubrobacterales bacterium]